MKNKEILRDCLISVSILAGMTFVCMGLAEIFEDNNPFASMAFTLAIALVSRCTHGYIYGMASSLVSVALVNFCFTQPFYRFNFTIYGYPLTFFVMLAVSVIISALTTQIKNQEALRAEAAKQRLRADLLKSVSHDIRTPLTAILGDTSVLLESEELGREEQRELLTEIQNDAQWLIRMTENILSITRFGAGGAQLEKVEEVAEEVLGIAVVKFRQRYPDVNVNITPPEEILLAPMDATLMVQVFMNIFENAARHGEHTKNIDVSYYVKDGFISFRIADDGEGFPQAMLADPFGRYDAHLTRPDQGGARSTGTGLTVCKAIVIAHGGSIKAYNQANSGAVVEFGLPMSTEE